MAVALKPLVEIKLPGKPLLTLADFDALPEGPPDYEFEGARLIDTPRTHQRHQAILRELSAELIMYLRSYRIGICWPEIDVQLSRRRVYVPDLAFLAKEHHDRYSAARGRIIGAPDLVVEIVSPASASRDPFPQIKDHVLLRWAGDLAAVDTTLRSRLSPPVIEQAVAAVPDAWLNGRGATASAEDQRAVYAAHLTQRLGASHVFVEEARRARQSRL